MYGHLFFLSFLSIAAAQITSRSVRFNFYKCDSNQQAIINAAWESALDIANVVYYNPPKYREATEVDFLGSYDLNAGSQSDMTKVLQNAATYTKPWPFNPFSWFIDIHCDDVNLDPISGSGSCSTKTVLNKAVAYTLQENNAYSKYPIIGFCDNFFKMRTCQAGVDRSGKSPLISERLNLYNYQCQGYAVLHEIFHLDWESSVGSQGHIVDYRMNITFQENGEKKEVDVYGPELTKVLAQYDSNNLGKFVSTSADNLAQYSLARWVTKKIGAYPHDPRSGLQPVGDPWVGSKKYAIVDGELTLLFDETLTAFANSSGVASSGFLNVPEGSDFLCSDENADNTDCTNPEDVIDITQVMATYAADEPSIPTDPPSTDISIIPAHPTSLGSSVFSTFVSSRFTTPQSFPGFQSTATFAPTASLSPS